LFVTVYPKFRRANDDDNVALVPRALDDLDSCTEVRRTVLEAVLQSGKITVNAIAATPRANPTDSKGF